MRTSAKILLAASLLLLLGGGWVLWRSGLFRSSAGAPDARDYKANPHWMEQTEFYSLYADSPGVVFLGTSLSARIDWAEALGRKDAAGRGVNGDVSAGILARVAFVTAAHPAICFVEGGINDLDRGIPAAEIVSNLRQAAQRLADAGIAPVLTAIFPVTDAYPHHREMNARIDAVNSQLAAIAAAKRWEFLNINAVLAPSGTRLPQFARGDGLHLTAAAYRVWIAAADSLLRQKGL